MSLAEHINPANFLYERHRKDVSRIGFDVAPTFHPVSSLQEIASSPLFLDTTKRGGLYVFSDYDGVFQNFWSPDGVDYASLKKIVAKSSGLTIVSARISDVFGIVSSVEQGYPFPLFPDELQAKITETLTEINPECTIQFSLGLSKLLPGVLEKTVYRDIGEHMQKGDTVVDIGSSFFDSAHFHQLCGYLYNNGIRDASTLHYYTTGHLLQ